MAVRASRYGSMHGTPSFLQERKCFRPTGSVHSGYLRKEHCQREESQVHWNTAGPAGIMLGRLSRGRTLVNDALW